MRRRVARLHTASAHTVAEFSRSLDQGGSAVRRRWPGLSGRLCLGGPACRTPGRMPGGAIQDRLTARYR